jgi:MFS family permease
LSFSARRARFANSIIFLVHGLVVATWVSRIPDVQTGLALSPGVLGMALLSIALGSLVSMPIAGALIGRYGSRACVLWTTLAFCAALAFIPAGRGAPSLSVLLFLYGATAGAMDVSMNSQGVTVERLYRGGFIMSSFHALFSVGGMIGSSLGGYVAGHGVSVAAHFSAAAAMNAALTLAVIRMMVGPDREPVQASAPVFAMPQRPLLALGALGFCVLLAEGAIADWTAIYLRDALNAGPPTAAAGYAVFSAAMSAGRFAGDSVTDRLGPVHVIRWGCLLAAAGLAVALCSPALWLALAGLFAAGIGYAAIVPNVFGAAGRMPGIPSGAGIAAVTTMGFTGFLIGPPAIGWLAEWSSLRTSLFLLVGLSVAGCVLAGTVRAAERARDSGTREVLDIHG